MLGIWSTFSVLPSCQMLSLINTAAGLFFKGVIKLNQLQQEGHLSKLPWICLPACAMQLLVWPCKNCKHPCMWWRKWGSSWKTVHAKTLSSWYAETLGAWLLWSLPFMVTSAPVLGSYYLGSSVMIQFPCTGARAVFGWVHKMYLWNGYIQVFRWSLNNNNIFNWTTIMYPCLNNKYVPFSEQQWCNWSTLV